MKIKKPHVYGKHNMTGSSEYYSFHAMKGRILNPKNPAYKDYGGRGIIIDPRYVERNGFSNFLKDFGKKPNKNMTIERINNNNGYLRKNIRWATRKEQTRNRRSNHLITFEGETKIITEWGEKLGIRPKTLLQRINEYKWSVQKALTTPTRHISKKFIKI